MAVFFLVMALFFVVGTWLVISGLRGSKVVVWPGILIGMQRHKETESDSRDHFAARYLAPSLEQRQLLTPVLAAPLLFFHS